MSKEEILKLRQKALEFSAIDDLLINLSVPAKHVLFLIDENQRLREALESIACLGEPGIDDISWWTDRFKAVEEIAETVVEDTRIARAALGGGE